MGPAVAWRASDSHVYGGYDVTKDCVQTELIQPYGFSPVLQVRDKLVPPERPEFPVYVAIKFFIYDQVDELFHLKSSELHARMRAVVRGLSARRVYHIVTNGGGTQGQRRRRAFTDFYDTSSHFVKKRMDSLNHGTILCVGGRGFRKAIAYRWNEPIDRYTLKSFRRLRELLGDRLAHSLDLYRIDQAFNEQPFTRDDFVQTLQDYRKQYVEARWFGGMTARSTPYVQFLLERLNDLAKEELVERVGDRYQMTEKGVQVTTWFDLFMNSVAYK